MEHSPAVSLPRLRTVRLFLREYRMADFDPFADHLAPSGFDRKDAWRLFGCNTGGWSCKGWGGGRWGLGRRGELVGNVGAFFREGWPEIELGRNTFAAFRARGFASEAVEEVLRYTLEVRREPRATALIDPQNGAPRRVAARLGMRHEADVELWGRPIGRYARSPTNDRTS